MGDLPITERDREDARGLGERSGLNMMDDWDLFMEDVAQTIANGRRQNTPSKLYAATAKVHCNSAASPCDHQKRFPRTVCEICYRAHQIGEIATASPRT